MPLIDLYARFLFLCVAALHCPVIPSILFSVIPSVAEESRGNDFFLIPRDKPFLLLRLFSRGKTLTVILPKRTRRRLPLYYKKFF